MGWQALAAALHDEYDLDDDDDTWLAIRDAYREVYDDFAPIVAERMAARSRALTAAGGFDPFIGAQEWTQRLDIAGVFDALGDAANDGFIAIWVFLAAMARRRLLTRAGEDRFDRAVAELDETDPVYLVDTLDRFFEQHRDEVDTAADWEALLRNEGPFAPKRSERWAASQLHAAINAGMRAGFQEADVAAIRWVTQRDEKVRPTHVDVDTDIVPAEGEFDLDGHPARYPGDPRLPIELRINCRCYLAWVDGTEVRRVLGARRDDLYAQARELKIRGRSKMNKAGLQAAILKELCLQGLAGGPDCPDLFDQMNKTTLRALARREGIRGRWRMTKDELISELRATLRGSDEFRVSAGYAPGKEFEAAQDLATRKRSIRTPSGPTLERGNARVELYAEHGGLDRGYTPCVYCGLKLHPNRRSGLAVLVPTPITPLSQGGRMILDNLLPGCAACYQAHGITAAVPLAASGPRTLLDLHRTGELDAEFHLKGTEHDHDQSTHAGRRSQEWTGYPDLDAAIDAFIDEPLDELGGDTVRQIQSGGDRGHGVCQIVSEAFVEFCEARGIDKVYATHTDLDELGYTIQPGAVGGEIGFDENDEMQYGHYEEHTVNSYYPPDGPPWGIVIDFTATQYGYDAPVKVMLSASTEDFHLQGQHDQKSHGNWAHGGVPDGARVIDDDEWADREGNERLDGDGDCYVAAYKAMRDDDQHRLVHGVVTGQGDLDGVRFDHAWVERQDGLPEGIEEHWTPEQIAQMQDIAWTVVDRSNGNNVEVPRGLYYSIGQINPATTTRYTHEEMLVNMASNLHYGPWEDPDEP